MASEAEVPEVPTWFERMLRQRDLSLFIPFILGFTNTDPRQNSDDPDHETVPEQGEAGARTTNTRDRIILINPVTQGMVVIEGGAANLESLLRELSSKDGQPPASKASIDALPSVEVSEDGGECVICLEEWELGGLVVKEMPCKHRFHAECIEKWLGIHGSCPVCRYKMPVDGEEEVDKDRGRERRRVQREIWVSFSFNGSRSGEDSNQTTPDDNSRDIPSPIHDQEMEG